MKTIKLLEAWGRHAKGTLLEVDEVTYGELVEAKTAVEYDPEAEKKAAEQKAEDERRQVAVIEETVKRVVSEAVPVQEKKPHIDVTKDQADKDPKRGFKDFGDFANFVKQAATDPHLAQTKAATGIYQSSDPDGGFLIPEEFRAELLMKVHETGQVYGRAQMIPMQSTAISIPVLTETARTVGNRQGGVRGYAVAEAGQATASHPTFSRVNLKLSKREVYIPVTDEMLSDSPITMGALLPQLAANEFGFQLDDALINGIGGPLDALGIMNAACTVSVSKETGQTAATIVTENVLKMWARLWGRSKSNAVWFVNQDCSPQLYSMYLGLGMAGIATFMPPGGISGSPYATLMGRPVIEIEQCATLGTVGDIILADMSQYLVGQKSTGIEAASSIHIRFDYGETVFRFVLRMDGQPGWAGALTPANGSNTQSPFITLATRS